MDFLLLFLFFSLNFMWLGVRHSTYRDARGVAHSYFFSWEHGPTRNLEVDWLDARNICRRHCMDAVSLETPQVSFTINWLTQFLINLYIANYDRWFYFRKMNSSNKDWQEEMFVTSGHRVANVTLLAAIELTCNHQMKMDGSGQVQVLKSVRRFCLSIFLFLVFLLRKLCMVFFFEYILSLLRTNIST